MHRTETCFCGDDISKWIKKIERESIVKSFFSNEDSDYDVRFILIVQEYHDFFKSWMNCTKKGHYYFSNALLVIFYICHLIYSVFVE